MVFCTAPFIVSNIWENTARGITVLPTMPCFLSTALLGKALQETGNQCYSALLIEWAALNCLCRWSQQMSGQWHYQDAALGWAFGYSAVLDSFRTADSVRIGTEVLGVPWWVVWPWPHESATGLYECRTGVSNHMHRIVTSTKKII